MHSQPSWTEWGISVLNGMVGDYLRERDNGLAIEMACYHQNRALPLTRESLRRVHAKPTAKLCILVHGLGCNEGIWTFPATTQGDAGVTYGTLLQQQLGYTPFYVRYNTGLPVVDNGKRLASLLEELLACQPVRVDEIVLLGHSMGGLVLRSACHYGARHAYRWVDKVRHAFYLGTPHEGADLEKAGHVITTVLEVVPHPITRLIGKILNRRSQGVKDLRFSQRLVEEGLDDPPASEQQIAQQTVPWLAHARHYVMGGTLTEDPQHALAVLLGDALVRAPRAGIKPLPNVSIELIPKMHHFQLAHDAKVYQQIRRWCLGETEETTDVAVIDNTA